MLPSFTTHTPDARKKDILRENIEIMEARYERYREAQKDLLERTVKICAFKSFLDKDMELVEVSADISQETYVTERRQQIRNDISALFQNWDQSGFDAKRDLMHDLQGLVANMGKEMQDMAIYKKCLDDAYDNLNKNKGYHKYEKPQTVYLDGVPGAKKEYIIVGEPDKRFAQEKGPKF